jgi:hypothetical protein
MCFFGSNFFVNDLSHSCVTRQMLPATRHMLFGVTGSRAFFD